MRKYSAAFLALLLVVALAPTANAKERFRFAEGKHAGGELRYIENIPVVTVSGTPEQMGEQLGTLVREGVKDLVDRQDILRRMFGLQGGLATVAPIARLMLANFPEDHRRELKSYSAAAGIDHDLLLLGNVIYDFAKPAGCSTLIVEPERSATGQALFGRNMDFPTLGFLDQYSVVTVYKPNGKHAFASVGFPGLLGCVSAINDAGLSIAVLEVNQTKDGSQRFNPAGVPMMLCFRRVIEECTTVDEAEKLLNVLKCTSMCNLAVCDSKDAAVFEITTKQVVRRPSVNGASACTNHFRTAPLMVDSQCWRYSRLEKTLAGAKLSVADVAKAMHDVNQGANTIQTMIFSPGTKELHLAVGKGPISAQPLVTLDLEQLFRTAK